MEIDGTCPPEWSWRCVMTFNAPSFFVGVGSVLGILAVGFGGGVLMSGVISDKGPREPSKIERHAAEAAKSRPVETTPVPTPAPPVAAPAAQPVLPSPQLAEPASTAP